MNRKFVFQIFIPGNHNILDFQLLDLQRQVSLWAVEESIPLEALIQTRVYLTDAVNQQKVVVESSLYNDILKEAAVSFVEQPMLGGAKVALQMCFTTDANIEKIGTPDCMQIKFNNMTLFFHSVRFREDELVNKDSKEQTIMAFERHIELLKEHGLTLKNNCHRTWLFVRDIDKNYSGVVLGRNQVFEREGLTSDSHYIASTGIGGNFDNINALVGVDFLSIDGLSGNLVKYLHALDYLNPTHEYGVAFERGTQLLLPFAKLSLISGTASIDKYGECVHRGDVLTQAGRLFLNIEKLLIDGGQHLTHVQYMIVYLRDVSDYQQIRGYLEFRFPHIPFLITSARVCRPEWLIEVECMAMS